MPGTVESGRDGAILNDCFGVHVGHRQTVISERVMVNCTSHFGHFRSFPDDWRTVKMPQLRSFVTAEPSGGEAVRLGRLVIRIFNHPHLMQQQYICAFLERTLPQIQRLPHRNLLVLNTLPTAQNS